MSGGDIIEQDKGDHQVVIFIFAGKITKTKVTSWNECIEKLKEEFGSSIMGVTIKGEKSRAFRAKGRR